MNHFINISDLNKDDLRSIIDSAKKKKNLKEEKNLHHNLIMINHFRERT